MPKKLILTAVLIAFATSPLAAQSRHDSTVIADSSRFRPGNPTASRLLFSATAYPLPKHEGYYWTTWFLLHGVVVGVSDRFSIGGGLSLVPGLGVRDNMFFITPKLTLTSGSGPQAAVGAFAGVVPALGEDERTSLGILYGVGTVGSPERNVSASLGWGYAGDKIADKPVVMIGGVYRVAQRAALISENWFVPAESEDQAIVSFGIRFIAEKTSVDVAYVNRLNEPIFPGVPWLGFSIKF